MKQKIKAIKTDSFVFVQSQDANSSYSRSSGLDGLLFDGVYGKPAFYSSKWLQLDKMPTKIEKVKSAISTNKRFELIDPEMASDKIPRVLLPEDVFLDPSDCWDGWDNHCHLSSLYEEKYDLETPPPEVLDFEIEIILEIDKIEEYGGFDYPIRKINWNKNEFERLKLSDVEHEDIDVILFPDLVLPSRTSKLTSEQSYKLVRTHIQQNIDPKYAVISSDYDFCFAVQKRVKLDSPESTKFDISRLGSKRPKYETRLITDRKVTIFEMTWDRALHGRPYEKYTPITPFVGKNIGDLKKNIDEFLAELMEKINEPLKDCPHCQGRGVICGK